MSKKELLQEGADYYYNSEGKMVLTRAFHLKRGYCCGNKCLHCPYNHVNVPKDLSDSCQDDIK